MKALTIWQPYAWLIQKQIKLIENRTWAPPSDLFGQTIAIHAGAKKMSKADWELDAEIYRDEGIAFPDRDQLTLGVIVATAKVYAVVRSREEIRDDSKQRRWFNGPIGWVLGDVRELAEPVPVKGMLGLWDVPEHIEHLMRFSA